jgi:hypothetical protein
MIKGDFFTRYGFAQKWYIVEMTAGEHEMLNLNNKKVSSPF